MPRPRRDGQPPKPVTKRRLTDHLVRTAKPTTDRQLFWDTEARGLALAVQPSGVRSWRFTYRAGGRVRIFTLGRADAITLADARAKARILLGQVASGTDPQAEKRRGSRAETFRQVSERYLEHAQKVNKSWRQANALVTRYLMPKWGTLRARAITRADVRAVVRQVTDGGAPVLGNAVLASASAIFTWAMREEVGDLSVNPCHGVTRNPTQSRERVLSDSEVGAFWAAFDDAGPLIGGALKAILLTGQRPGEVSAMRREHIRDGWWELPGDADPKMGWPGTKNKMSHRVWLTEPVRALLAEVADGDAGFAFPADKHGRRPVAGLDAAMRRICKDLGLTEKVTPHDLRRTHGTAIAGLGFGRDAMNRLQNHKEGGIGSVYDRHNYAEENKRIQEAVTQQIVLLAVGTKIGAATGIRARLSVV
jgi:integrase